MTHNERYSGNLGAFNEEELGLARRSHVGVVGCGGLGGYVINALARFGVGAITLIDGDNFAESNLNRQLFATSQTLGESKVQTAGHALGEINSDVEVTAHHVMLTEENAIDLLNSCDLSVDCLDNIPARRVLADACSRLGIPLVHGAISGLYGQVACVYPGDRLFERIYPSETRSKPITQGNPVFTPQLVAAIQACEAIKLICGRDTTLRNAMLYIDLNQMHFETIRFE